MTQEETRTLLIELDKKVLVDLILLERRQNSNLLSSLIEDARLVKDALAVLSTFASVNFSAPLSKKKFIVPSTVSYHLEELIHTEIIRLSEQQEET